MKAESPAFSQLAKSERLALFAAPLAAALGCGSLLAFVDGGRFSAAFALVYLATLGIIPNVVLGGRIYKAAKQRGSVGLGRCTLGGILTEAVAFGLVGLAGPLLILPFEGPTKRVLPTWFGMIPYVGAAEIAAMGFSAMEGAAF